MEARTGVWKTAFVGTRLLGLYLVVHALVLAASDIQLIVARGEASTRWAIVIACVVVAALGAELWLAADSVADRIELVIERAEPEEGEPERHAVLDIDSTTALAIGFILVGVVVLADALPALGLAIGNILQLVNVSGEPFQPSRAPLYWFLFGVILRIALGLILIFEARKNAARLSGLGSRAPVPPAD